MLREPYRVIDIRGAIMQAVFRCPVCGRRNDVTRCSLDKIEPPNPGPVRTGRDELPTPDGRQRGIHLMLLTVHLLPLQ